jgi:hypothetical protein
MENHFLEEAQQAMLSPQECLHNDTK